MTRPLPVQTALLALLVAGCLPHPDELIDATNDPPPHRCDGSGQRVEAGRWRHGTFLRGSSAATRPGEIAPVRFEVTLSDWTSEHLLDMQLEMTVSTGQALPGQTLVLRHGGEPFLEATLGGPNHNEALFALTLPRELCGTPCVFSLELAGAPTDADVPVPLKIQGQLFAFVDAMRGEQPCGETAVYVEVTDAL